MLGWLFRENVEKPAPKELDVRTSDKLDALLAIVKNHRETFVQIWDRTLDPAVFMDPRVLEEIKLMLVSSGTRLEVYTTPETFEIYTKDHPYNLFVNFVREDDHAALHAIERTALPDHDIIVGGQGRVFISTGQRWGAIMSEADAVANLRKRMAAMAAEAKLATAVACNNFVIS